MGSFECLSDHQEPTEEETLWGRDVWLGWPRGGLGVWGEGLGSDQPPVPSCVYQHASGGNLHTNVHHVSLLWELHHHGDHPHPRTPYLAALHWLLYVWVSGKVLGLHRGPEDCVWVPAGKRAGIATVGWTLGGVGAEDRQERGKREVLCQPGHVASTEEEPVL